VSYDAIYRARAAARGGALDVFVPQVFGDTPIKVTESVGGQVTGMGWVMFQGGDPAHPVWLPDVGLGSGGGADEVRIGPDEPGSTIELWYDTDATSSFANGALVPPGGIANQVLSKTTNTDYDTRWVNAASGGASDSSWKQPVRVATPPYANHTFLSGLGIQVDGVTLVAGDRVLLTGQSSAYNNGIWIAATGNWARAPDCDTAAELMGATVVVLEGATNADTIWTLTNNAPITLGTTALAWSKVSDEIWVGPDTPLNAATELWYDTDEANLTDVNTARWNSVWGVVGMAAITAPQTGVTTGSPGVLLTGSTVTITAVAGRRYKFSLACSPFISDANTNIVFLLRRNASNVQVRAWHPPSGGVSASQSLTTFCTWDESASGSVTWDVWFYRQTGGGGVGNYADAGVVTLLTVEDVGPVTQAANPPLQPASVWTPLQPLLVNSWTGYGAPYGPAYYRMVGDEVQLRGLIQSGSSATAPICTLPVGYRPQYEPIFSGPCNGGVTEIRVSTGGVVSVPSFFPPAGTAIAGWPASSPTSWMSLANVRFSVL
jgi:hypothetical protein